MRGVSAGGEPDVARPTDREYCHDLACDVRCLVYVPVELKDTHYDDVVQRVTTYSTRDPAVLLLCATTVAAFC